MASHVPASTGSPATISPKRTLSGKTGYLADRLISAPNPGIRCNRSVGLASKFSQLGGAESPQPNWTYEPSVIESNGGPHYRAVDLAQCGAARQGHRHFQLRPEH